MGTITCAQHIFATDEDEGGGTKKRRWRMQSVQFRSMVNGQCVNAPDVPLLQALFRLSLPSGLPKASNFGTRAWVELIYQLLYHAEYCGDLMHRLKCANEHCTKSGEVCHILCLCPPCYRTIANYIAWYNASYMKDGNHSALLVVGKASKVSRLDVSIRNVKSIDR